MYVEFVSSGNRSHQNRETSTISLSQSEQKRHALIVENTQSSEFEQIEFFVGECG